MKKRIGQVGSILPKDGKLSTNTDKEKSAWSKLAGSKREIDPKYLKLMAAGGVAGAAHQMVTNKLIGSAFGKMRPSSNAKLMGVKAALWGSALAGLSRFSSGEPFLRKKK